MNRPSNEPDKSPLTQDDQPNAGAVHGAQRTGNDTRGAPHGRDLPRGSEPEVRGTSGGR